MPVHFPVALSLSHAAFPPFLGKGLCRYLIYMHLVVLGGLPMAVAAPHVNELYVCVCAKLCVHVLHCVTLARGNEKLQTAWLYYTAGMLALLCVCVFVSVCVCMPSFGEGALCWLYA